MDGRMYCMPQSNAVRDWVRRARADEHMDLRELDAIADRIDREMVELPCDRDGVPIHVGDTVYTVYTEDGHSAKVIHIDIGQAYPDIVCLTDDRMKGVYLPSDLVHEFPDSLERIADELEAWCDGADVDGDACEKPRDLAERIRKLAEMEG